MRHREGTGNAVASSRAPSPRIAKLIGAGLEGTVRPPPQY